MNPDDIRQNVRNSETWERAMPMLVHFIAYYFVIQAILTGIMLVQFLSQLLFQKKLEHLYDFSIDLTNYSRNLWLYLTFTSERRLFPFAEWSSSCLLEEPFPHHHDV